MNEIEKRELKGIDGWLVLFQIHIIYGVANYGMALIIFPIFFIVSNRVGSAFDVFDIYNTAFLPYFIALIAVSFVLSLLCMILFYRRKMVFRTVFVVLSAVVIVFMVLFYIFSISRMFNFMGSDNQIFATIMRIFTGMSMLVGIAPNIALVIALYKSYRVKNTFS